jgi:hypothetical protein
VTVGLLTAGCGKDSGLFFSPVAPTPASPAPTPRTSLPFTPAQATELPIGGAINAVVEPDPPECVNLPGWPCQFFDVTAPATGTLVVTAYFDPATQPYQGIDLSVLDSFGLEVWANSFAPSSVAAERQVEQKQRYRITLWYTFPGLAYEVMATMK